MTFFFVVNPGLEDLALAELQEKWTLLAKAYPQLYGEKTTCPAVQVEKGGLTLEADASMVWPFNVYLKIPTRILQRLGQFTARDYIKLFNMIAKMPWHDYLRAGDVEVEVSYHQSALNRKERLRDTVLEALKEATKRRPFRKAFLATPQIVLLRMVEDVATLSVDLSGEALYKRGYKEHSVEAPIRETLAAAMWYHTLQDLKLTSKVPAGLTLADPMCGSGTLLSEAALFYEPARRHFAFENFPCAPQTFAPQKWISLSSGVTIEGLIASDSSEKAIEASQFNFEKAKLKGQFQIKELNNLPASEASVVLCNPPYGERLSLTKQQMDSLLPLLVLKFNPERICVIVPESQSELKLPNGYKSLRPPLKTYNGGLRVQVLLVGKKA